jgi:hypothetical protein
VPGHLRTSPSRFLDPRFWLGFSCLWLATKAFRSKQNKVLARQRAWFFLIAGFYCTILWGGWPEVTTQDYLPILPVLAVLFARLIDHLVIQWPPQRNTLVFSSIVAILCTFQLLWLGRTLSNKGRSNTIGEQRIAQILRLTHPGETVFDAKGEAVFRPRPTYWIYEILTRERMALGLIKDDMPEHLISTKTAIGIPFHFLTPRSRNFIESNYVLRKSLLILGRRLTDPQSSEHNSISFVIAVPQTYTLLDSIGVVPGELDGHPALTENNLTAGEHFFRPERPVKGLQLIWSRAWQAGLTGLD